MEYDSGLKAKYDYENTIAYAVKKAEIKGRIEGQMEGAYNVAFKVAIRMLSYGYVVEKIAQITKLALQDVENLK